MQIFLGAVPTEPGTWVTASNLVGVLSVLVPPLLPGTARPKPSDLMTNGEFTLEGALATAGVVTTDPGSLEDYLNANLTWQVQKVQPFFSLLSLSS